MQFLHYVFGSEYLVWKMQPLNYPVSKKNQTLPVVLSKQECKQLFKAPPLALLHQARQQALNIA
jgi:site-specific recombinase XerD